MRLRGLSGRRLSWDDDEMNESVDWVLAEEPDVNGMM